MQVEHHSTLTQVGERVFFLSLAYILVSEFFPVFLRLVLSAFNIVSTLHILEYM